MSQTCPDSFGFIKDLSLAAAAAANTPHTHTHTGMGQAADALMHVQHMTVCMETHKVATDN